MLNAMTDGWGVFRNRLPAGLMVAAGTLVGSGGVRAAVVDFGEEILIQNAQLLASGSTGNPTTAVADAVALLSLPKFDSSLGTLVGVQFSVVTDPGYSLGFSAWGGRWEKVDRVDVVQELSLSGVVGGLSLGAAPAVVGGGWNGPFAESPTLGPIPGATLTYTLSFTAGDQDLSGFVGSGAFEFELRQRITVDLLKGNGFSSSHIHQAGLTFSGLPAGSVTVTYDFVPDGPVVPEPEEWAAALGLGLGGWALWRRRRG